MKVGEQGSQILHFGRWCFGGLCELWGSMVFGLRF
jgi:hypothetical protein